jgi:hypothetical protein
VKKPRLRTARREHERDLKKLVRDKARLAELEVGGAPERPIEVDSPSVIPVRARSTPCPLCGGELRLEEETAEVRHGVRLRAARMTCALCGVGRQLWFRLGSGGMN